jgi:Uma2 family endonuclease
MKVIANGTARYPDVSVTCSPVDDRADNITVPILVVEVISPSTEREDRGRKKFDYLATPSIQQYAIIDEDERRIDLYSRSGDIWTNEVVQGDAILRLSCLGVEISLDTIYEDTELHVTRRREDEPKAPAL